MTLSLPTVTAQAASRSDAGDDRDQRSQIILMSPSRCWLGLERAIMMMAVVVVWHYITDRRSRKA
eukprot:836672-Rhodomonas_salina.3